MTYFYVEGYFPDNAKSYHYITQIKVQTGKKYLITNENGYNYRNSPFTISRITQMKPEEVQVKRKNCIKEIVKALSITRNNSDAFHAKNSPIKNIWFNDEKGITVVQWIDGEKTKVVCNKNDTYNREVGVAMCALKKLYGSYSITKDLKKFEVI